MDCKKKCLSTKRLDIISIYVECLRTSLLQRRTALLRKEKLCYECLFFWPYVLHMHEKKQMQRKAPHTYSRLVQRIEWWKDEIQYITHIPHSVLIGDENAHSTLWYSYTDDHSGQLIADVISNLDHITLNTNTPTRVPNTTLQQTSSPDITTVSNTMYNRT